MQAAMLRLLRTALLLSANPAEFGNSWPEELEAKQLFWQCAEILRALVHASKPWAADG